MSGTKELSGQKKQRYNAVDQLTKRTSSKGGGRWSLYPMASVGDDLRKPSGCSSYKNKFLPIISTHFSNLEALRAVICANYQARSYIKRSRRSALLPNILRNNRDIMELFLSPCRIFIHREKTHYRASENYTPVTYVTIFKGPLCQQIHGSVAKWTLTHMRERRKSS
jgi:hypothetical protein